MNRKNTKYYKNPIKILIIYNKKNLNDLKCIRFINRFNIKAKKICSENFRKENLGKYFKYWTGDYILHLSSYYKISEKNLKRARYAINFHPGSPKYPGSGAYTKAIYNSDRTFGITTHFMNKKIDNGKIIKYFSFKLNKKMTLPQLISKTDKHKFICFKKIVSAIVKPFGHKIIIQYSNQNKYKWSRKRGTIKEIDKLQKLKLNISKHKLKKIIKSTMIDKYKPYIILHGYKFEMK